MIDFNWIYCGYFTIHTNIESLYYTLETNTVLYIYMSVIPQLRKVKHNFNTIIMPKKLVIS